MITEEEKKELMFRAYEHQFEEKATWGDTAKHLKVTVRTLYRYKKKYPYKALREEFAVVKDFKRREITIERRLPEEVRAQADASLMLMSQITHNAALILNKWVDSKLEIIKKKPKDILTFENVDLNRLERLLEKTAKFTTAQATGIDETEQSTRTELVSQFTEARKLLDQKNKR